MILEDNKEVTILEDNKEAMEWVKIHMIILIVKAII